MAIADEMQELAASVGLPLVVASLPVLEERIAQQPFERAYGAFLGEVIRLSNPTAITWVEHDGTAALHAGGAHWFPLDKVRKFQRNGRPDSIAAFAGVVIGMYGGRTPEQIAAGEAREAQQAAKARVDGRAFVADPNVDTLLAMTAGIVHYEWPLPVVQDTGLRAALFLPFLGEKPRGLGTKRAYPGARAAEWIARMVQLGVDSRDETLALLAKVADTSRDKEARGSAAKALGLIQLRDGVVDLARFTGKDRAVTEGMLSALASVVWRWFQAPAEIPFTTLTPVFQHALAPKSPHLASALGILTTWTRERPRAGDVASVIDELLVIGALQDEPKLAKSAVDVVAKYARAIALGHAADDERVATQVAASRAKLHGEQP